MLILHLGLLPVCNIANRLKHHWSIFILANNKIISYGFLENIHDGKIIGSCMINDVIFSNFVSGQITATFENLCWAKIIVGPRSWEFVFVQLCGHTNYAWKFAKSRLHKFPVLVIVHTC